MVIMGSQVDIERRAMANEDDIRIFPFLPTAHAATGGKKAGPARGPALWSTTMRRSAAVRQYRAPGHADRVDEVLHLLGGCRRHQAHRPGDDEGDRQAEQGR